MPNTQSTPTAAANNTAPSQPGAEPRLISAVSADGASPQFKIPVSSQAIQSVESVDLDLVLTTTTGEKIILQQGALQAATAPDSKIVFQNGDSITAADQIKKLGVLKPVEGGSFRLKSGDASPAVAELVTGDGFGLGKELQDTMSQLTETSKQLEKVLQTLSTATLSNTADDSKPITAGPGTGTGVQKITPQSENKFASPSPGSPPQPEVEKFTSNNTDTNIVPAKVSVSMLAANQNGVTYQNNALGKTEVRQFLGKTTVELTMTDKAQALEFSAGKVDNQLLLSDVPKTNALILSINTQQIGFKIPDGLTVNGQAINAGTPLTIDVSGMENNSVPLNLQWNEGSSAASSDFQMSVAYLGPNGQINLKTITFTGKAEYAYTLDANGEPRQFIASQADNLVVTANNEDNTITLGNGADTIKGSGGADTINGGAGKDTVDYSASTAAVNVNVSSGSGTGGQAQGDQLNNIETLTGSSASDTLDFSGASTAVTANLIQGTSNQKLNGSAQDLSFSGFENVVGSANDDRFVASSAANDLKGGTGSDTVDYSNSAAVVVNLHTGVGRDSHAAGDTYNSIENLIGGAGNDTFFASEAANSFTGNGGVNRVNYEHSTAGVTVNLFTGKGSGGFAKDDSYATIQNATGSNFNDTFVANNEFNNFVGGNGTDTVSYENATGNVTVNLLDDTVIGSGSDAQGDRYSSIENAVGGAGNDTFISGTGANRFDGKGGSNTVSYAGSTAVKVSLETGEVSGGNAVGDTFAGIQNLTGGDGADALTGDGQANTLTGGAGNDILDGGAGDDTFIGGAGADRFTGGTGTDTVSYAGSSAVSIDINFNGTGTSRGTGNAAGDVIGSDIERVQGSGGDDTFFGTRTGVLLDGGTGTDSIDFSGTTNGVTLNLGDTTQFLSIERVVGSNGSDNLTASNNGSTLVAQNGNDTLTGGTGADFFNLDTGNDTLVGDVANGGGGNDSFVISQSKVGGGVVNLDGGSGIDTLRVIAGATLDLSSLNAKNFEKIDLCGDGASTQVSLSKTDILALVDSDSKTLTLRLDSTDSYVIEPEIGISVTQGQSVSFYTGTIASTNLVAEVKFEYA
ncbi:MAG: calcium-binding protein [Limnohabitans sp.]|uniref:beta strand repeat-containing protein n=1 Tax=Limnohabitans sp. TaxID=1907725 RepID=UPI003BAF4790